MTQTRVEKVFVVNPGNDMPHFLFEDLILGENNDTYMALYMDRPGYFKVKKWLREFFPELRDPGVSKVLVWISW